MSSTALKIYVLKREFLTFNQIDYTRRRTEGNILRSKHRTLSVGSEKEHIKTQTYICKTKENCVNSLFKLEVKIDHCSFH